MTNEEKLEKMKEMRSCGATYQEIGDAFGITRQRAHQLLSYGGNLKSPTKRDLYEQILDLQEENLKLTKKLNEEKIRQWNEKIPYAVIIAQRKLYSIVGCSIRNLKYEHVDEGGYWFTFNLDNDERTQTYAVRHSDIEKGEWK